MTTPKYGEERNRVLVGNLPDDFLRVDSPSAHGDSSGDSVQPTQASYPQGGVGQPNSTLQLTLGIMQAQLAKNYSLTKMDPYVRVRVGHSVFETHSDMRGGKFPNWNKTVTTYLPPGVKTVHIEVFDERTLTPDERVAYTDYVIPDEGLGGKFIDTWVPLSGKQGQEKEGSINITVFVRSVPYWSPVMQQPAAPLMVLPQSGVCMPYYMPGIAGQPVTVGYPLQQPLQNPNYPYPAQQVQPYRPTEDDIKQMLEMFPSYDREVIIGVLENCRGNKDQATTSLLALGDK